MRDALKQIQEHAEKAGISQAELARRSGLGQTRINNWFVGVSEPKTWAHLERLAAAAGLQASIVLKQKSKTKKTGG